MNLQTINSFLNQKNIAVIGVSATGKGFGVSVYKHLKDRNYNAVPINPKGGSIDGDKLEQSLKSLHRKIDAVVTVVPPEETEKVVMEAKEIGINKVWMQQGSESQKAIQFCKDNNMDLVHGECIMMFSEPVKSIHRFHRGIAKIFGKYPK
jgi:predicted CoA-binding protein